MQSSRRGIAHGSQASSKTKRFKSGLPGGSGLPSLSRLFFRSRDSSKSFSSPGKITHSFLLKLKKNRERLLRTPILQYARLRNSCTTIRALNHSQRRSAQHLRLAEERSEGQPAGRNMQTFQSTWCRKKNARKAQKKSSRNSEKKSLFSGNSRRGCSKWRTGPRLVLQF